MPQTILHVPAETEEKRSSTSPILLDCVVEYPHLCLFFWYTFEHFAQHKVGNAYYFLFVSFHAMHPWTTKLLAGQEYGAEKFAPHPVSIVMYFRDLMNTVNAPSKGNFTNATCRSHHVSLIFGPKTTCIPRVVVHCWPQWRFCMHLCTV